MNYIKEYSEEDKTCQYGNCDKQGTWRRQNTQYVNDKDNWKCFCKIHQKINDKYWEEMWKEYYNNVM